jgi:hypothetical protein
MIPNSPGPFVAYTKAIVAKEIVDPYTIRFKTATPYPLVASDMSTIYIVSKKAATGATTEDFNTGKAAIGSGRYKYGRYVSGDRVDLVRNDNYWGDKSPWEKVTFKIIKNGARARRGAPVRRRRRDRAAADGRSRPDQGRSEIHRLLEDLASRHLLQLRSPRAGEPLHHRQGRASRSPRIRSSTCVCAAPSRRPSTGRRSSTA